MTTQLEKMEQDYLDTTMLESKINASGWSASENIKIFTDRVSEVLWLAPVLTYEWIILMNPLDTNPKTFTEWADASHELFFYKIHKAIEIEIYPELQKVIQLVNDNTISDETALLILDNINSKLKFAVWKMGEMYRSFDKEAFSRFRSYFSGINFRLLDNEKYPGPSWASSCIFPTLDIVLGIETVAALSKHAHIVRPKIAWRWYTTIIDMEEAAKWVAIHGDLYKRYSQEPELLKKLDALTTTLKQFRNNHQWNVKKYLPEVFAGTAWTGWANDVPKYLSSIIENTISRITPIGNSTAE